MENKIEWLVEGVGLMVEQVVWVIEYFVVNVVDSVMLIGELLELYVCGMIVILEVLCVDMLLLQVVVLFLLFMLVMDNEKVFELVFGVEVVKFVYDVW